MPAFYLTRDHRTLYESKGLEFNDVGLVFFRRVYTINDKIKVLLYNFFENSTATPSQWRLVLNRVSDEDDLTNVPTFDETRHASICVEVHYLRPDRVYLPPLMLSWSAVEVPVCCNYSSPEEAMDCR